MSRVAWAWVGALALLAATLFVRTADPADEALRAQADSLRQIAVRAEIEADMQRARAAMAVAERNMMADSLHEARIREEQVTRQARAELAAAAQAAEDAEARVRVVLDSLGLPTADVDVLRDTRLASIAALERENEALRVRVGVLTRSLARADAATAAASRAAEAERARAEAVEAERNLYAIRLGVAEKRAARAELEQKVVMGLAAVGAACGAFDQKECSLAANGLSFAIAVR